MEYVNVQSSYEKQAASRNHSGAGVTMLSIDKTPGSSQLPNNRRQAQKSPAKRVIQSATSSACSSQASSCWTQEEIEIQEEYEVEGDILEDDCVNGSDEELEIQPSIAPKDFFNYSVKIVNPLRMKDFRTVDLGKDQAFQGIKLLRQFISKSLPSIPDFKKPDVQNVELGYVGPGHGMKGKKVWLLTDGDVSNMYETHKGKPSIRLWCYSHVTKKESASSAKSASKDEGEVDDLYKQLQKKHEGLYTPEQLRTWAHMVRLKTHDSLEEPPDKPFFRGRKRPTTSRMETANSPSGRAPESKRAAHSSAISPGRKVNIRSELISQLDKWHKLLDSNVITQNEYDELKGKILSDIKEL